MLERAPLSAAVALATIAATGSVHGATAQDFEAELDVLMDRFPSAVDDTTTLEALDEELDVLEDRIRDHRRANRSDLTREERDRLSELDDHVDAYQDVITVVGQLRNTANMSLEDFERVAGRLGLEPEVVHTAEPGLEVVRVDVGSFRSFLIRNTTGESHVVNYSYRTPSMERDQSGIGSSLCNTLAVFSGLLNTRDKELSGLEFTGMRFTDMGAMGEGLGDCG